MTKNELGLLLHQYDVYDALQFILGAQNAISNALFCKDVLHGLHDEVQTSTDKWSAELSKAIQENSKNNKVTGINSWPNYDINIAGVEISSLFVQNFLVSSFFQNSRNAFDILAQAANAGCLASCAKKIETVDFPRMKEVFQQKTYKEAFPAMSQWFEEIAKAPEFKYIDDYCNRTKHTCSLPTKFTIPIFNTENKATVPAFYREKDAEQHKAQNVFEQVPLLYEFLSKAYHDFMIVLKQEITKRTYTENRIYSVKVYQQKYVQSAEKGFSMAFIDATDDFSKMPETIQVLFARKLKYPGKKEEVQATNCFFDTIYVKEKGAIDDFALVGKYVAKSPIGEDSLLQFRKYIKAPSNENGVPLIFQAMEDVKQKEQYYRRNHFFDVKTVSDDEELLQLAGLAL